MRVERKRKPQARNASGFSSFIFLVFLKRKPRHGDGAIVFTRYFLKREIDSRGRTSPMPIETQSKVPSSLKSPGIISPEGPRVACVTTHISFIHAVARSAVASGRFMKLAE